MYVISTSNISSEIQNSSQSVIKIYLHASKLRWYHLESAKSIQDQSQSLLQLSVDSTEKRIIHYKENSAQEGKCA